MSRFFNRSRALLVGVATGFAVSNSAMATYSIVAVDRSNQLVGGVGASCVGSFSVAAILGTAPGFGAIHAQAALSDKGRDRGVRELEDGKTPAEIISTITASSFDSNAASRQYGVVSLTQPGAGWTGSSNGNYANDVQGDLEDYWYSVQGNILTSAAVIEGATEGFLADGCDLPDRLMLALEAGGENGEGDSRCTPRGVPADSAFLRVVDEQGEDLIFIEVTNTGNQNPLVLLREKFDQWRETHDCPDDDSTTSESESSSDESAEDSSSESGSDESSTDETSTSESSTGDDSDSSSDTSSSSGSTDDTTDTGDDPTPSTSESSTSSSNDTSETTDESEDGGTNDNSSSQNDSEPSNDGPSQTPGVNDDSQNSDESKKSSNNQESNSSSGSGCQSTNNSKVGTSFLFGLIGICGFGRFRARNRLRSSTPLNAQIS